MHADTVISTPTLPHQAQQTALTAARRVVKVRGKTFIVTESGSLVRESAAHSPSQPAAAKTPPAEQPGLPVTSEPQQAPKAALTPLQAPRYIPLKTVLERAGGFSKSTWHDWSNPRSPRYDPTIPRSVCLSVTGRGCVRWVEAEVDAWLASKAEIGRK